MVYKYGIDFGTTNSSVSIATPLKEGRYRPNLIRLDPNNEWGPITFIRSVFYVDAEGQIHIGSEAIQRFKSEKIRGTTSGRSLITQIKKEFNLEDALTCRSLNDGVNPVALLTELFKLMKVKADKFAQAKGIELKGAVIGVPVSFGEAGKQLYLQALCNAGYYSNMEEATRETEFVSEPVAVAVHYGEKLTENKRVMVFDYGGGTLDIAVIDLKEQVGKNDKLHPHRVIGKSTGYNIGGEWINKAFFEKCIVEHYGIDELKGYLDIMDPSVRNAHELWDYMVSKSGNGITFAQRVEECKKRFTSSDEATFAPPEIHGKRVLPSVVITREEFHDSVEEIFKEVAGVIKDCLDDCRKFRNENGEIDPVEPSQISGVFLAGGSSLVPKVKDLLAKYFDRSIIGKNVDNALFEEEEVLGSIASGLSIVGCGKDKSVDDILDTSYGIWDDGRHCFSEIIPRNTRIASVAADELDNRAGISKRYRTTASGAASLEIKVTQRTEGVNNEQYITLKEITVPLSGKDGEEFVLYFSVDSKSQMLVLKIYSVERGRFFALKPEQSRIRIKL